MVLETLNSETPNIKDLSVEDFSKQEKETVDFTPMFDLEWAKEAITQDLISGGCLRGIKTLNNFKLLSGQKFREVIPTLDYNQTYISIFNKLERKLDSGHLPATSGDCKEMIDALVAMKSLNPELYESLCQNNQNFTKIRDIICTRVKGDVGFATQWLENIYAFSILSPDESIDLSLIDLSSYKNDLSQRLKDPDTLKSINKLKYFCDYARDFRIGFRREAVIDEKDFQLVYDKFEVMCQYQKENKSIINFDDLAEIAGSLAIIAAKEITIDNEGINIYGNIYSSSVPEINKDLPPLPETRNF